MTYQEFKNKYNGKYVDYDGSYGGQCWDLAQQYITECLGLPESIIGGCGLVSNLLYEPFLSKMKEYFDIIPQTEKKAGDIQVWGYGHIAIMDHWDGNEYVNYYFSQNPNPSQVMPLADDETCVAFRKKGSNVEKSELEEMTEKYNKANKKLEDIQAILNRED